MNYRILHPVGGTMNHDLERGVFEYEDIWSVEANSLNEAYLLSQNDFSEMYDSGMYARLGVRSTSVGDIIIEESLHGDFDQHFFVNGLGFVAIPHTVAGYIDWGNHMQTKNELDLNAFEAENC
jgi:hypothetical protein